VFGGGEDDALSPQRGDGGQAFGGIAHAALAGGRSSTKNECLSLFPFAETLLTETQRPHFVLREVQTGGKKRRQGMKSKEGPGKGPYFVFKRQDAIIAWPKEFLP